MKNLRHVYIALFVLGTLLPGTQLVAFVRDHGLDIPLFFQQAFSVRAGAVAALDVLVSSLVLWVLVLTDGRMAGVRHLWAPLLANLVIGVSSGLPLYLYLREKQLEETLRAH